MVDIYENEGLWRFRRNVNIVEKGGWRNNDLFLFTTNSLKLGQITIVQQDLYVFTVPLILH